MEMPDCTRAPENVRDAAATWFARVQDRGLSAEEQADFDAWYNAHPSHEAEYQWLATLCSAVELLPTARLHALCEAPAPSIKRRSMLGRALAASVLAVAVGAGVWTQLKAGAGYHAQFATQAGERRTVNLPDGSTLELDSRSRVRVDFADSRRRVDLQEGEVMFSVAHDTDRPFVVQAGLGQVTVTGTRFDVRREGEQARVVVESGHVQVQGRNPEQAVSLTAGLGTRVDGQGIVAAPQPVNTQALTAWRKGQLIFNDASLGEVAAEVSRYRDRPLHVSTTALAQLRLSSVFKTDDTDALINALPRILPVLVKTRADGSQEIISR